MTAPMPETRTAIVLLNWSSVSPSGTWKTPLIPIHVNSAAATVPCAKIRQLQIKLTSTAAIEIALLNAFHRSVNNVIAVALASGARRISQGTIIFSPLNTRKDAKFLELEIREVAGFLAGGARIASRGSVRSSRVNLI